MAQEISQITDSENSSLRKIEKDTSFSLGQYGAVYESGTTLVEGAFGCITALEDSAFTLLTSANWSGDGSPTYVGLPLKTGVSIFGSFTQFQLTSGKVIAYKDQ